MATNIPTPPTRRFRGNAPRLALTKAEAADALGMSINSFERHVQPELRLVRRGKLRVIPISEIERWLDTHAALTLGEEHR